MAQRVDFIDISHHNTVLNFDQVAAAGVLGVIAKASQGTSFRDPDFVYYRVAARSAGLKWASYHFLEKGNAARQMDFYLSVVEPVQGERVVIDFEPNPSGPDATIADLKEAVLRLKEVRPDLQISVYGASYLTDAVNSVSDVSWLADTSLWGARYSSREPTVGKAWLTWTAWQYTQTGRVAGVQGDCDLNAFNGSRENCVKWFGPVEVVPEPQPEPEAPMIEMSIHAPTGTRVVINGQEIVL